MAIITYQYHSIISTPVYYDYTGKWKFTASSAGHIAETLVQSVFSRTRPSYSFGSKTQSNRGWKPEKTE